MTAAEPKTRSPIKDLPVRQPGQGLREAHDRLLEETVYPEITVAALAVMGSVGCWIQYVWPYPYFAHIFTAVSACVVALAVVRVRRAVRVARRLNLGRIGEEAVGQLLDEQLRPMGAQVLHDIPGDGFNIDHVVIHAAGIYMIETKTHSKPVRGQANVRYDGERVTVNGHTPDRDPIVQANANARWLADLIEKSTGTRHPVRPVVLYPGWYVENLRPWPPVWVLNEKQLLPTIRSQQRQLSDPDVHLVTYHLKRYVLAKNEELRKA